MMHLHPDLVRRDKLANFRPRSLDMEGDYEILTPEGSIGFGWETQDLSLPGACGDASDADAERGRLLVEHAANRFVKLLDEVHRYPLVPCGPDPCTRNRHARMCTGQEGGWHSNCVFSGRAVQVPARRMRPRMAMTRYRLSRRATLGLAGAAAASVLVKLPGRTASAQVLDKVSYQTSWRAQAEHGGFYQAVAAGHLQEIRDRVRPAPGRTAGQRFAAPDGRPGRHDHVERSGGAQLRQGGPAVPLHRRHLPEGPAGADRPCRLGQRQLREAQGQDHPGRRRRPASPTGPS